MADSTSNKFHGIHTAIVTPFNLDGSLDLGALTEILAQQKMDGINGLVMAGTTGEAPCLSLEERILIVKCAKQVAGSALTVMAGAGSNCTKTAIAYQKAMEEAGADASLQVVPYYNKPSQDGLRAHFEAIAQQASVPIFLYNAAGRTGIDLGASTVAQIAQDNELVVGIKDANSNMERLINLIGLSLKARPDFIVLAGEDSALLPFLAVGAHGIISVSSHVAAHEMRALYEAFMRGDLVYAQKIAEHLNGLYQLMFSHSNPIPIKTLLAAMGMMTKTLRLPLTPMNNHDEVLFLQECRKFSFIKSFKQRGFLS